MSIDTTSAESPSPEVVGFSTRTSTRSPVQWRHQRPPPHTKPHDSGRSATSGVGALSSVRRQDADNSENDSHFAALRPALFSGGGMRPKPPHPLSGAAPHTHR